MLGWILPEGEGYRAIDLLGRRTAVGEWLACEEALEALGIGYLAGRYILRLDSGAERPVRIVQADPTGIVVATDEFGAASAVGSASERIALPFPIPDALRPE